MLINELRLQAKHLLPLYYFYRDLLDLPVTRTGNQVIISAGRTRLIFNATEQQANPFYHFAFNIPSNQFKEALHWMEGRLELLWLEEYKSFIADFASWHAKSFYFKDPAGNILEMIARFDLNDIADSPFRSKHIRSISEIGIVFPGVSFDTDVTAFMAQYSLPYFDKQPPLRHFRAIGDDEGLFIAVEENRIWYSTKNDAAKIFPAGISFVQSGELFHREW